MFLTTINHNNQFIINSNDQTVSKEELIIRKKLGLMIQQAVAWKLDDSRFFFAI